MKIVFYFLPSEHPGDGGVKLAEAVLSATNVQLDAFRYIINHKSVFGNYAKFKFDILSFKHICIAIFRVGAPEGEFHVSMDCTHGPNDDVHILGKILSILS